MNTKFAANITVLLALTLGGSYLAYSKAVHPHEAHAEAGAEHGAEHGAAATEPAATEPAAPDADAEASTDQASDAEDGTNNAGDKTDDNTNEAGTTGNTPAVAANAQADSNKASADGDAAAGAGNFASSCAGCHGQKAEGGVGPALALTKDWSLEEFTTALREGRAPEKTLSSVMPRFIATQVSDQDIANI